jgi:hypothetical protein
MARSFRYVIVSLRASAIRQLDQEIFDTHPQLRINPDSVSFTLSHDGRRAFT